MTSCLLMRQEKSRATCRFGAVQPRGLVTAAASPACHMRTPHAHTYAHAPAHIRAHTHTHTRTHTRTCAHTHTNTNAHMHTLAYTHAHAHTRTHTHARMHAYKPNLTPCGRPLCACTAARATFPCVLMGQWQGMHAAACGCHGLTATSAGSLLVGN